MKSLIPKAQHPFFIVAPSYTRGSAGTTCLYILCDQLNRQGFRAFILPYPYKQEHDPVKDGETDTVHNFQCPIATLDVIKFYDSLKLTPIVIYPEILDNLYNAPFFGRYILNYAGLLAPFATQKKKEDFMVFYSRLLASGYWKDDARGEQDPVLFIPTCDLDYWVPQKEIPRSSTCFYAQKARKLGAFDPTPLPDECIEILPSRQMDRDTVREIFQTSSMLYCFEDTALGIEAQLCGCPVTWVPNQAFSGTPLAEKEINILTQTSADAITENDIDEFRNQIKQTIVGIGPHISALANQWIAMVADKPYLGTVDPLGPPEFGIPRSDKVKGKYIVREGIRSLRRQIRQLKRKFS